MSLTLCLTSLTLIRFIWNEIILIFDSIDPVDSNSRDDSIFTPEFWNSIKISGLPNHSLRLRICTPVMLLRNIDPNEGLSNGTRLQIIH